MQPSGAVPGFIAKINHYGYHRYQSVCFLKTRKKLRPFQAFALPVLPGNPLHLVAIIDCIV